MQETKLTVSKCCLILPYALVVPLQINSVHKLSKDKIAPGGVMSSMNGCRAEKGISWDDASYQTVHKNSQHFNHGPF